MKKCGWILIFFVFLIPLKPKAQAAELEQLILNLEKLAQFKKILQNMYDGYTILHQGYTAIKDISEGNFNLHKGFLDALFEVSPTVKQYHRVADIISYQLRLVKESKAVLKQFKEAGAFAPNELEHIEKIYGSLLSKSLQNLEELAIVLTAGKLRMSDADRLEAIDQIYMRMSEHLSFLKEFNSSTAMLSLQRQVEKRSIQQSKTISGL